MGSDKPSKARRRSLFWRIGYKLFRERMEFWRDSLWRVPMDYGRRRNWVLTPVDAVFRSLEIRGLVPKPLIALEVFGRQGLWKTVEYAERCDYLEFYEIHVPHADLARKVLPKDRTEVIAADSVKAVREGTLKRNDFSFVLIDSFTTCFGPGYCEFFDLFPKLYERLAPYSVLVINAFMDIPDDHDCRPDLLERRQEFYGLPDPQSARHLTARILLEAHRRSVPPNFEIVDLFLVPHPGDTVFVVMCLKKR